jgi:hypothetical protein
LADFITITFEFRFSVHTAQSREIAQFIVQTDLRETIVVRTCRSRTAALLQHAIFFWRQE